jgi:hypothetical protein
MFVVDALVMSPVEAYCFVLMNRSTGGSRMSKAKTCPGCGCYYPGDCATYGCQDLDNCPCDGCEVVRHWRDYPEEDGWDYD